MASNTKRDLPKRKLAQIIHSLKRNVLITGEIHLLFSDGRHDDYVKFLELIIQNQLMTLEYIKKFWIHAYGSYPDNVDVFRR